MTELLFVLVLVLQSPPSPPIVVSMADRDMCEAAAAEVQRKIPGVWQHVCIPRTGAATR